MTHQVQHTQTLPGPAESGRSPPIDGRARRIWENGRVSVERRRLLILDCDGVLVDSERLSIRIHRLVLAELGWDLDLVEIVYRFVGRPVSTS